MKPRKPATQPPNLATLRRELANARQWVQNTEDDYDRAASRHDREGMLDASGDGLYAQKRVRELETQLAEAENAAHVTAVVAKMDADQRAGY